MKFIGLREKFERHRQLKNKKNAELMGWSLWR
jgi:hypothetical protein